MIRFKPGVVFSVVMKGSNNRESVYRIASINEEKMTMDVISLKTGELLTDIGIESLFILYDIRVYSNEEYQATKVLLFIQEAARNGS